MTSIFEARDHRSENASGVMAFVDIEHPFA